MTSVLPRPSAPAERTGGFHGRTISIISFSTDPDARGGFGPFTPGFDVVPYGDPGRRRRRGRLSAGQGARRGIVPLSAAVADADVLGVLQPVQHGSTFGGNPLACAVGRAVVELLADTGPDGMLARARRLGDVLHGRLAELVGQGVVAVRGVGLWAGIDVDPRLGTGREVSEGLVRRVVLVKDTHGSTVRLPPPLVITEAELAFAVDAFAGALGELR